MTEYKRNCPQCRNEIQYSSKKYYNRCVKMNRKCKSCGLSGRTFKMTKKRVVSEETKRKLSKTMKGRFVGENAGNWKGGRHVYHGYRYCYVPEHPKRINNCYVSEHILVIEKIIGRYLKNDEVVHHMDGDKLNNKIENLMLMLRKEHSKLHADKRWSIK